MIVSIVMDLSVMPDMALLQRFLLYESSQILRDGSKKGVFTAKKGKREKNLKKKVKKKEGYEGGKNLISARRINLCEKEFFSRMFTR